MNKDLYKKAKELFARARALPKKNQAAFVSAEAKENSELKKEVLAMLENDFDETILAVDQQKKKTQYIDPLGLNKLQQSSASSKFIQAFFNTRGRAALAFFVLALIIAILGFAAISNTKKQLANIRGEETSTILLSNVQALKYWLENYKNVTELAVADVHIAKAIELFNHNTTDTVFANKIDSLLVPYLKHAQAFEYTISSLSGEITFSSYKPLIGKKMGSRFGRQLLLVSEGKPQFVLPFYADLNVKSRNQKPLVWMMVPVRNEAGEVFATFGIGRQADSEFTKILRTARMGLTGETYAINREGWFISESRHEHDLRTKGMMHEDTNVSSILNLQARELNSIQTIPQLTKLASNIVVAATDSTTLKMGVNSEPTQDYKGESVIGAWIWLPQYNFGVISQVNANEAFRPARKFYFIIGIAILLLLAASMFSFYNALELVKFKSAVSTATRLGQYELKNVLGEGGMGTVYFAQHSLLKRPTAIKVVRVDKQEETVVNRFEREVKLASQLSYPNTVEIFDYGFTQEGQAYYAMEFIDGINLNDVVKKSGPMDPSRVIYILKQICGSLVEAHTLGLVHRDIKPQNIMLCNRIGLPDFVKVLDFGLAKMFTQSQDTEETREITGTPVYMAPERIKRPGTAHPSGDIYAVGALAYFLLAGFPMFSFSSDLDVLYQVLNDKPKELPSHIPEELRRLVFHCVEKDEDERPNSIEELKMFLDNLADKYTWTKEESDLWWKKYKN